MVQYFSLTILWQRHFAISYDKTSYRRFNGHLTSFRMEMANKSSLETHCKSTFNGTDVFRFLEIMVMGMWTTNHNCWLRNIRDKIATISQVTFSNVISWKKIFEFQLKYHWSKSVPKGPTNNIPALVQMLAWRRPGDKPLSEPVVVSLLTHVCVTWPEWVQLQHRILVYQSLMPK